MRAADAIEKITVHKPVFLANQKTALISLLETATDKEFKWHLALLVSRLDLSAKELAKVREKLTGWATDKQESRIVRVHAIQALFDLEQNHTIAGKQLSSISAKLLAENIPSITARLKKLGKGRKTG